MRLNEMILLILTLFFIVMISGILIPGSAPCLDSGLKLDEKTTLSRPDAAVLVFHGEQEMLIRILHDWAPWDDTYDYILKPERSPSIERNLEPATFRNIGIDLFVLSDTEGNVIWGRSYDAIRSGRPENPAKGPALQSSSRKAGTGSGKRINPG
jgi:sensor domain CHASE-containing protein